jgi:hypothetical protein
MAVFGNKDMFWLMIKIHTPSAENAVNQTMSTDTVDSVIQRLESIIDYLRRNYKKGGEK